MLTANQIKQFASLKQKKYREEHGKYLIEGFHLIEECLNSPHELEYIILREGVDLQGHTAILEKLAANKTIVEPLPEKSFNKLTDTESSQGIVGVVAHPKTSGSIAMGELVIALDRVSDPGNLGTIIRTAYWFGVKNIILSKECADPYNPKVIRSTQGGIFHLNITEDAGLLSELNQFRSNGYSVYLFTLDAEKLLSQLSKSGEIRKSVLVFGSEAHGISKELIESGFEKLKIEGYSKSESLNVAISAGIALYEFKRLSAEI